MNTNSNILKIAITKASKILQDRYSEGCLLDENIRNLLHPYDKIKFIKMKKFLYSDGIYSLIKKTAAWKTAVKRSLREIYVDSAYVTEFDKIEIPNGCIIKKNEFIEKKVDSYKKYDPLVAKQMLESARPLLSKYKIDEKELIKQNRALGAKVNDPDEFIEMISRNLYPIIRIKTKSKIRESQFKDIEGQIEKEINKVKREFSNVLQVTLQNLEDEYRKWLFEKPLIVKKIVDGIEEKEPSPYSNLDMDWHFEVEGMLPKLSDYIRSINSFIYNNIAFLEFGAATPEIIKLEIPIYTALNRIKDKLTKAGYEINFFLSDWEDRFHNRRITRALENPCEPELTRTDPISKGIYKELRMAIVIIKRDFEDEFVGLFSIEVFEISRSWPNDPPPYSTSNESGIADYIASLIKNINSMPGLVKRWFALKAAGSRTTPHRGASPEKLKEYKQISKFCKKLKAATPRMQMKQIWAGAAQHFSCSESKIRLALSIFPI